MRIKYLICAVVVLNAELLAQDGQGVLRFETASLKPTQSRRTVEGFSHSSIDVAGPGRVVAQNASLEECLQWAYEVKKYQISGPAWMASDEARYDIEGKAPSDVSAAGLKLMLQSLLQERLGLRLHKTTRSTPVYELRVDKGGPRLRPADTESRFGYSAETVPGGVRVTARRGTMAGLANRLSLDVDRVVIDETQIPGAFQIDFTWFREGDGPTVFTALREQLGLKLQAGKADIEILVVDAAQKVPVAN